MASSTAPYTNLPHPPLPSPRLSSSSSSSLLLLLPRPHAPLATAARAAAVCRRPSPVVRAMSSSFGSRLEESVRRTVSDNSVVIYSKTRCSYSMEVKALLKRLGVDPLVIELDELGAQGPQIQKVLARLTGQHTVPNVFIGGKHIGGCTDTVKLHRKGELTPLLTAAGIERNHSPAS